jgi:hypothetical protein
MASEAGLNLDGGSIHQASTIGQQMNSSAL